MPHVIHITTTPAIDLAEDGNIFSVLAVVSRHLRESGVPEQFVEELFNAVISSCSYSAALAEITRRTGLSFTYHGRSFDQLGRAH